MRINKYLAECGVASRRAADELIKGGSVKINGQPVTMGQTVNLQNDTVTVDGKKIEPVSRYTYILFNKPKGCITTASDELGRKTVFDYIDIKEKINCVGRLDYDSEGLLIMTNDGDMAHRLTHPSNEVPKTYQVWIEGEIPEADMALVRKGIDIDGIKTARAKLKLIEYSENISKLEMTIHEGRNRQVRKMFEAVNKNVIFLRRIAIGDLKLGGLGRGKYRHLNANEVNYLKNI